MAAKALNVHKALLFVNVTLLLSTITIFMVNMSGRSSPIFEVEMRKIPNTDKTIKLTYVNETLVTATIMQNDEVVITWDQDMKKQVVWLNNCMNGDTATTNNCMASSFKLDFSDPDNIHAIVDDVYFDEDEVLYIIDMLTK